MRLFLALVATLAIVGAAGYALISDALHDGLIDGYRYGLATEAKSIEAAARGVPEPVAESRIELLLGTIGRRPGTEEAILVGPDLVVRASGEGKPVGARDANPRTVEAIERGVVSAGREADPGENRDSFEFVYPVELPDGRYALEVAYTSAALDSQLAEVRRILGFTLAGAFLAIVALFYLLGGRSLLRSHRIALERATRDGLTELPNHRAFQDDLRQAAGLANRNEEPLSLALLDVDEFKLINDRHGHQEGDLQLRRLARILREGRSADRPYRIGGDEFAVLLPNTDEYGARAVIGRLERALDDAGLEVSIGVAGMGPGGSLDELRAEADAALYDAKRRGGSRAVVFADTHGRATVITAAKRDAVRRLVEEGGFRMAFQPIWRFQPGQLLGIEALMRPDPEYGLSGPTEAFDIAARIGRVRELDQLCAARTLARADELPSGALLFLNVSPKTLELDLEEDDWLIEAVSAAGLAPRQVVVEVTERIGANADAVVEGLHRLRKEGFQLAIDDVGTGNSGLEMLRRIGADYVKIDRSIVHAAASEANARAVLLAMATFARQTGAFVIAEGVEDTQTLDFVQEIEAVDLPPGSIVQGGQGFELGGPGLELPKLPFAPTPPR